MNISTPPTPQAGLHRELEAKSVGASVPALYYRTLDTPVGKLLLARTEAGIVRVAFECEKEDAVLQELADRISPKILRAPQQLDGAARWLNGYFSGQSFASDLMLDLRLAKAYRREVLSRLRKVSYGQRVTYQRLAAATSFPNAVRAVGSACATNPLPLLIPCHRVVRSDGSLGNYRGGPAAKEWLLNLEAATGR